ncbi:MAG TPA: 50S ribosomal protein L16 [Patescibacteria group bacterium]|nr:50S ribosomal protein L16 [Patescibacteria group bacterium]
MLEPKRAKYRKQFRGRMKGKSIKGSTLAFGDYGLKSLGRGWLMARQIEAARKAITHQTKRQGKIWIRVFPDKPVTKKPAGVRMGSGKGAIDHHVAVVTPGRIIFELAGVDEKMAKEAIRRAGAKLPFKIKFIKKE